MQAHNYENDAKLLRDSMKGMGTDENTIIQLTATRSYKDRLSIKQAYKTAFGRDILEDLKSELSGDFLKVVQGMWMSHVEYDVIELYNAFKGAGTDEDAVSEIIGSRNNSRLREIKTFYKEKYKEDLEERTKSETSVSILQCNRDESNQVNQALVFQDVKDLYAAGEGKWGTDEEVFNRIFVLRNSYHLKEMNNLYMQQRGKSLIDVIESEFSGDIKILLKTILHAHINPADYFADRIYKACKGWGTNDQMLIRALIVMDDAYMEEIKKIYKSKFKMTLAQQIENETSGDYKKMLLMIINTP